LLCPAGGSPLSAGSPPLATRRDSTGHDPAARPGSGPPGVRIHPRPRHPTPDPHARDPVACAAMAAPPAGQIESGHPKTLVKPVNYDRGKREGGGEIRPAGERSDRSQPAGQKETSTEWKKGRGRPPGTTRPRGGYEQEVLGRHPGGAMRSRATRCSAAGRQRRGSPSVPRGPRARGRGGSARIPPGAGTPIGARALPERSKCW
jgi:hypothetical protein